MSKERSFVGRAVIHLSGMKRRASTGFRRWIEDTQNFIHLSLILIIPLLIASVTFLSNRMDLLPFLLFPPLASGTYTLFANPESRYASPRRFVGGMTIGALCGWIALEIATRYWEHVPSQTFYVHPVSAAFTILLTGLLIWILDLEEAQAFSTALLVLVVGVTQFVYVISVFVSSSIVAVVFLLWRDYIYEERAQYLYQTTHGDDHVLVPVRNVTNANIASFGAQLAASHDAGKVVLLKVMNAEKVPAGKTLVDVDRDVAQIQEDDGPEKFDLPTSARGAAEELEDRADRITDRFDIPCEVVIIAGDPDDSQTVAQTAQELNCDLIVTAYETANGKLSQFVRDLFASSIDVVAIRTNGERTEWNRILIPIKHPGDVAHAMLDFADRLVGEKGHAAICQSIETERNRRKAEEILANLAETFDSAFETRVTTAPIEDFLSVHATNYDLTIVGSSTERTAVSRFIDPPTFQQLDDLECDLAIVHRG